MNRPRRRAAWLIAPVLAAALALPASAFGARFGASMDFAALSFSGETCDVAANPCTQVEVGIGQGTTVGPITAPFNGRITRILLRADQPGSFRLQLARVPNPAGIDTGAPGKVTRNGPLISYVGSAPPAPPESFKVHVQVRKGEYLAALGTTFAAERCAAGTEGVNEMLFQPPLSPGAGFKPAYDTGSCLPLIQAVVKHVKRHKHKHHQHR